MRDVDTIAIKEHNKMVVLEIPPNTARVILDPKTALGVANAIAESAYIADHGIHPDNALKAAAQDAKALKLYTRIPLVLKSLEGKPKKYIAKEVVDICLSEVL